MHRSACVVFSVAAVLGVVGGGAAQPLAGGKKLKVEIAKAKVTINGTAVTVPTDLAAVEKVLGAPSGTIDDPVSKSDRYVYWSKLGVRASQSKTGKQHVQELDFSFVPAYDLSAKAPAQPFSGELILEGQSITKATNWAELGPKLKGAQEVFRSWRVDYEEPPLTVYVNPMTFTDPQDKGVQSVRVAVPLVHRK